MSTLDAVLHEGADPFTAHGLLQCLAALGASGGSKHARTIVREALQYASVATVRAALLPDFQHPGRADDIAALGQAVDACEMLGVPIWKAMFTEIRKVLLRSARRSTSSRRGHAPKRRST